MQPADKLTTQYGKSIMFLIDRSGSMHGHPMQNAKAALKEAVMMLNEGDFFNIIQFDHEQITWAPTGSVNATETNKQQAGELTCSLLLAALANGQLDLSTCYSATN